MRESKLGIHSPLEGGQRVGTGAGPAMDIVLDAIDGRNLLAQGRSGAISVVAAAPRGAMWSPAPALYMEKIVVNGEAARSLVEGAWTRRRPGRWRRWRAQEEAGARPGGVCAGTPAAFRPDRGAARRRARA